MGNRYVLLWLILLFFLGITTHSYSQSINFEDSFEDGNFTSDPTWSGDDSLYTLITDEGNNLLRLDGNDGENPAYLSTPSTSVNGSWEFYIQLDFAPSNSNKADIFLMSDIPDLNGSINGYALRAGETGSDDVFRIVRYDDGSEAEVILSDTTDISSGGGFRVKVTRQAGGLWSMEVAEGYDGVLAAKGETATDDTYSATSYFGVRSTYTSTRSDKFFYDFKIDLPPFTVTETVVDDHEVNVSFNRPYEQTTVQITDFSIDNSLETPTSLAYPNSQTISLRYDNPLPSGQYTITTNDIQDVNGEAIATNTTSSFLVFGNFNSDDVIINEFMYDPPTGQSEYIELRNRTDKFLNLQNWQIGDNMNFTTLSPDTLVLPPDNFLAISTDTVRLSTIYGDQHYIESNLPALNNTGDAIRLITDTDEMADSLTYTSGWGGNGVALERRSGSTPGIYRSNWDDSPADSAGTPGGPNQVAADEAPPLLTELDILSNEVLRLAFNERLDSTTASDNANYSLGGELTVSEVDFIAPDSVLVSVDAALPNATELSLAIQNISDIFGNSISPYDTTFTHYAISEADSGDIFINEFNYNPASGETEYIEIYNSTEQSFDLQNWTLNDNRGIEVPISSESFILPPESFAVLAPDNTLQEIYPDIKLAAMGSSFPALNNSGDDIVLKKSDKTILDSLQYSADWGGNKRALERKTTTVSAIFKENWGTVPQNSGSPGTGNQVPKDKEPPELVELYPVDESKLQLVFSESVTTSSATDLSNYQLTPSRNIQLVSAQADSVTLFLSDALISGESYEVNIAAITDIFGNKSPSVSQKIEYLQIDGARAGDIVINEIMPVPSDGEAEFVELYNRSDKNIDLKNWSFGDASGEATISRDIQLRAQSYLILTGSPALAQSEEHAIRLASFPNLNNTGDILFLRNNSGTSIDSLHYRASWGEDLEGHSLERKDPLSASNDPSNWQSNHSDDGNSAGIRNTGFMEDTSPPQVLFAKTDANEGIEIRFDEFIRLTDELRFTIGGQALSVSTFDSTEGNRIILQNSTLKAKETGQKVTVENVSDIRGNSTQSSEAPVAQPLESGDLVINEIMFNPLNDADDNLADQSEYVELYNKREYALSLEGILLHDAPNENGQIQELQPVSTTAKWVSPEETVLVYADQAPAFAQSLIATFFDVDSTNTESIIQVDRSSLSLASDDALYIADSTGTVIDSIHYSETWHNPNLVDTRGIALERITPDGESNEQANWNSSAHPKGGTPMAQNSIHQDEPQSPQETGISFTPNPFSPDGDGYEDNLVISYKLDNSDYLLRVNIFDRYGRHIKEMADGKPAGFEGSLIWNGLRDDGRRNRIGIYIIVFEAYDSASGSDKAFKKPVVIARKLN